MLKFFIPKKGRKCVKVPDNCLVIMNDTTRISEDPPFIERPKHRPDLNLRLSLKKRIIRAYGVLIGRYDAVKFSRPRLYTYGVTDDRCKFILTSGSKDALKFKDDDRRFFKLPGTE